MGTGLMLDAVGFVPNAVQEESTQFAMRAVFGLVPGGCYALGWFALRRMRFDEAAHAAIRSQLDDRALRNAKGPDDTRR
jgi:Na+/melibiose symporter-like transporter